FLVNDRQEVYTLGEAETGEDLQFNILVRPLPETMTGQLYLVTTLISDLRLSLGLPTSMSVVPFYRVPAIAAADQPAQPPLAILLNEVQFFENNQPLKTLQTRFLEVYTTNEAPLTIRVNGEVYGHDQRNIRLYSVLLPAFEQKQQSFSSETGTFSFEETVTNLEKDQDIHLLILASEAEANVLNPGLETASTQQV